MFTNDVIIGGLLHKATGRDFETVRDAIKSLPIRKWDGSAWVIGHSLEEANKMMERYGVRVHTQDGYKGYRRQRISEAESWCRENMPVIQERIADLQSSISGYSSRSTSRHLSAKQGELSTIRRAMDALPKKEKRTVKENDAIIAIQEMLS
jgi:hypothetical protein